MLPQGRDPVSVTYVTRALYVKHFWTPIRKAMLFSSRSVPSACSVCTPVTSCNISGFWNEIVEIFSLLGRYKCKLVCYTDILWQHIGSFGVKMWPLLCVKAWLTNQPTLRNNPEEQTSPPCSFMFLCLRCLLRSYIRHSYFLCSYSIIVIPIVSEV